MKSGKAIEKIYVLPCNVDRDFKCDYVLQTAKILSLNAAVIIAFYTNPFSLIFLLRNRKTLFQLFKNWKKIIFSRDYGVYECEFLSPIPFQRFKFIYEINKKLTVFELKLLLFLRKILNTNFKIILWLFHPSSSFFLNKLNEKISLYDCVDHFETLKGEKNWKKDEEIILKKAGYLFANSMPLAKSKKLKRKITVVPCGFATGDFKKTENTKKPKIIDNIKKPIAGFVGHIDYRIDFELLKFLLKSNKKISFLFIGRILNKVSLEREKKDIQSLINELKKYSNFFLIDEVPKAKVKDYLASFDISIIPYDNSYKSVYYSNPMKFYEYLSFGLPVVSTYIPSLSRYRSEKIRLERNFLDFNSAIQNLLENKTNHSDFPRKGMEIARRNSWKRKVEKILKTAEINSAF